MLLNFKLFIWLFIAVRVCKLNVTEIMLVQNTMQWACRRNEFTETYMYLPVCNLIWNKQV